MRNNIIQSMWIGKIGVMETLCMKSYLAHGHEFHLYVYPGHTQGAIPKGVIVEDANNIVPFHQVRQFNWLQQSGDFFRVALLLKKGNWWVDLDSVALRPFDFEDDYVFCATPTAHLIQNNPMKVPEPGTPLMQEWYDDIVKIPLTKKKGLRFHGIGPDYLGKAVPRHELQRFIQPLDVFDPVHWDRVAWVIDPNFKWDLSKSFAIHWFHAAWDHNSQARFHKISPRTDGKYHPDCLYETMKRRYGVV